MSTTTTGGTAAPPSQGRRHVLQRRVRLIVAAVIGYNIVEAAVAISSGVLASSTALVSFGLDSCVEVLSAAAIAWQFAAPDPERREKAAVRIVAIAFFALAAYVGVGSAVTLIGRREPDHSTVGIVLAAVSLAVMPLLSWFERRTGHQLGSASVVADSKQTLLCTYLSAVLLVGLVVNSLFGWGWADPVAALVIAVVAVKEGVAAWRGDICCAPASALLDGPDDCCTPVAAPSTLGEPATAGCADGCCAPVPVVQVVAPRVPDVLR